MSVKFNLLRYPLPSHNNSAHFHFDRVYDSRTQAHGIFSLEQIGDLSCKESYYIAPHSQTCYEICYVVSGCGHVEINGNRYKATYGDLILTIPGDIHSLIADKEDPFRLFYIGFNFLTRNEELSSSLFSIQKQFDQLSCPITRTRYQIEHFFTGTFNELVDFNPHSLFVIESFLRQIVVFTFRNFYGEINFPQHYETASEEGKIDNVIYEVVNYIDQNLLSITELTLVSEAFNYSYPHLSRLFSKEIGLTLKEYFNRKRFEKAVTWLKQGNQSVTQIATRLNYQSIHSFSRAFRHQYGMAPKEFQNLFLKSNKEQ